MGWPLPGFKEGLPRIWALPGALSVLLTFQALCFIRWTPLIFCFNQGSPYMLLLSHHVKINSDPQGDFFPVDLAGWNELQHRLVCVWQGLVQW